jgi:hypothetical protein
MGAAEKVSVSLSAEDLRWAKARAKRELTSVSAVLAEALRKQRQAEARTALLAELGTDDINERERAEARREWSASSLAPRKAKSRRSKRA